MAEILKISTLYQTLPKTALRFSCASGAPHYSKTKIMSTIVKRRVSMYIFYPVNIVYILCIYIYIIIYIPYIYIYIPATTCWKEWFPQAASSPVARLSEGTPWSSLALGSVLLMWSNADLGVSKNSGKTPQIIHFNRVFHEINHPFWGTPIFGLTPILSVTFSCLGRVWFWSTPRIQSSAPGLWNMFSRESENKPSCVTVTGWGVDPSYYLLQVKRLCFSRGQGWFGHVKTQTIKKN